MTLNINSGGQGPFFFITYKQIQDLQHVPYLDG